MSTFVPEIVIEALKLAALKIRAGTYGTVDEFVEKSQLIYSSSVSAVNKIITL
jgi:hypothetical protein